MVSYNPKLKKDYLSAIEKSQTIPKLKDIMNESFETLQRGDNIKTALELLINEGLSGVVVAEEDQKVAGFLSEKDCLRQALDMKYHNSEPGRVEDYMTKYVTTLAHDDDLFDAIELFTTHYFHIVPVVNDEKKIVGIVDRRSALIVINSFYQSTW